MVNNYRVALCNIHWEKGGEIIKRHKIRSRRISFGLSSGGSSKNKMNSLDPGEIRDDRDPSLTNDVSKSNRTVSKRFQLRKVEVSLKGRQSRDGFSTFKSEEIGGEMVEQCHYRGCFQIKRPPSSSYAALQQPQRRVIVPVANIKLIDISCHLLEFGTHRLSFIYSKFRFYPVGILLSYVVPPLKIYCINNFYGSIIILLLYWR